MPQSEAEHWDERYQRERDFWLERQPRQLLKSFAYLLPSEGRALDAASGMAINGLFLAQHGFKVFALDISEYALNLAVQRARSEDTIIEAAVYDLSNPWLPPAYFDVILNFHFLERAAIPVYRQAITPGGLIFFDTYVRLEDREDIPIYYLEPGELLSTFVDFEIIHYAEDILPQSEFHGERGIAQLVARKPEQS
jgi:2-polyprenyl-3-methyl-5-hydroxy-6-metoxy-1,4-benzoquinol methylase